MIGSVSNLVRSVLSSHLCLHLSHDVEHVDDLALRHDVFNDLGGKVLCHLGDILDFLRQLFSEGLSLLLDPLGRLFNHRRRSLRHLDLFDDCL